ncbi:MAG: DUF1707 SHOCT-like domain-containing protein [Jiangellaceae bacterium]
MEPSDDRTQRASDADRDCVAEVLRAAAGDGRLSLAELQERLEALCAAKKYGELAPVVADLPVAHPHRRQPQPPARAGPDPAVLRRVAGGRPTSRSVKAVFGGVEVIVPEDVVAVGEGMGVFGAFDDQARDQTAAGGLADRTHRRQGGVRRGERPASAARLSPVTAG